MKDLYGMLPEEIDALVAELGQPRYRSDQLLHALYHGFPASLEEVATLPKALRAQLSERGYTVGAAVAIRAATSTDGQTHKLLLRMSDGILIETVLMQYPNEAGHPRSTVCVSSQAGCAMGCVFCATGQMGFERNLAAAEIVAQVVHIGRVLQERGEHVTNVVFMGMGEPMANYAEVVRALRILIHPRAFGLGQRHITVSTVGLIRGIDRLAGEGLQVGLAISLHAPNEELRQRLVPTAGPTSVHDLVSAARRYFRKTGRRVTFEYALIRDENDSPAVARQLAGLLSGTGTHVNIIPVNPTAGGFQRPPRARVLEFEQILLDAGVNCTVRVEKGTEISAACGQLRTDETIRAAAEASEEPAARHHGPRQSRASREPSRSR